MKSESSSHRYRRNCYAEEEEKKTDWRQFHLIAFFWSLKTTTIKKKVNLKPCAGFNWRRHMLNTAINIPNDLDMSLSLNLLFFTWTKQKIVYHFFAQAKHIKWKETKMPSQSNKKKYDRHYIRTFFSPT